MDKEICKKVMSMMAMYIENKTDACDTMFIENHFYECQSCYRKFLEMKEIMNNLHFEYEKMMNEFALCESDRVFNVREYETFYNNISPYIDDELCYDESIKFRKYLLKSKTARNELADAYCLKNGIKRSVDSFKNKVNVNLSKKVINKLKGEKKDTFEMLYKRAAVMFGLMIFSLFVVTVFVVLNYFNRSYAQEPRIISTSNVYNFREFPEDNDLVEFYFDENRVAILTDK